MPDWFETRFTEPVEPGSPDPELAARMRALVLAEWDALPPSTGAARSDPEGELIVLDTIEPEDRTRTSTVSRSRPRWLPVAAAVAAAAVMVGLATTGDRPDDGSLTESSTTESQVPAPARRNVLALPWLEPIDAGPYWIDPDDDPTTPLRATFEVFGDGWLAWTGAAKESESSHILMSIVDITNLTQDACNAQRPLDPPVGPTVEDLALALSQLAPFEVAKPATDVTAFGHPGKHLQLRVPDLPVRGSGRDRTFAECRRGRLASWYADDPGDPFYGYGGEPGRTEDFYILDVEGTRVVVVVNASPAAPPEDMAELTRMFDSVRFEP